jgi:hypothetical protein
MGAAREKVRVARALPHLPLLGGALQRGEISYAKVRALTRIAKPATEERLLAIAHHGTASQVERLVRASRWCDRREDDRKQLWRSASCWVDEDGVVVLRARLMAEQGAVVQRALEAASDHLYKESRQATAPDRIVEEVTSDQRRADALTQMAEVALSADLDRGSAGDRYQVVLHLETAARPGPDAPPVLELGDGPISVSAEPFAAPLLRCLCDGRPRGRRRVGPRCRAQNPHDSGADSAGADRPGQALPCSPAATRGAATPITSITGRTVGPRRSTTCCWSAVGITGYSTKAAAAPSEPRKETWCSGGPTAGESRDRRQSSGAEGR